MRQEIDYGQFRYEGLSLMWPDNAEKDYFTMSQHDLLDLNFQSLMDMLEEDKLNLADWICQVPKDKRTSLYRQKVMQDIITNPGLYPALMVYGEQAHKLMTMGKFAFEKEATVYNLLKRTNEFDELELMLESLLSELNSAKLESKGMIAYRDLLQEIVNSPIYESFSKDVKSIKDLEEGVKSIKIGLNLDEYLQPNEAILLELSGEEFKYDRFKKKIGYYVGYGIRELKMLPRMIFARDSVPPPDALNTLEKTIEPATLQLITFCDQFTMRILEVISILYHELPFFYIGKRLHEVMKGNGESMVLPTWNKPYVVHGLYHISLGIDHKETIIKNDFAFDGQVPITVLTGANRGGKTTYTQALCQCIWLAQLGYYIPAQAASLPYVDNLFIHFPAEEKESVDLGRLGEECRRFRTLFDEATKDSMVFLNESFQGTSHQESLQISIETIQALNLKGSYSLFNTHLHELVENLEAVGCPVNSLIAGKNMEGDPFRIEPGRPLGKSYADKIAKRYGMTYDQLVSE